MARMIAGVYDALRSAGADEDKARAAATALAGPFESESRFDRLGGQIGQIDGRMDRLEGRMDRLDTRMDRLEGQVAQLDVRVGRLDARIDQLGEKIEQLDVRVERLDGRVAKLESDMVLLKWMVGFLTAAVLGVFFLQWQVLLRLPSLG